MTIKDFWHFFINTDPQPFIEQEESCRFSYWWQLPDCGKSNTVWKQPKKSPTSIKPHQKISEYQKHQRCLHGGALSVNNQVVPPHSSRYKLKVQPGESSDTKQSPVQSLRRNKASLYTTVECPQRPTSLSYIPPSFSHSWPPTNVPTWLSFILFFSLHYRAQVEFLDLKETW